MKNCNIDVNQCMAEILCNDDVTNSENLDDKKSMKLLVYCGIVYLKKREKK